MIILGFIALIAVDYLQLLIPELYSMVINGVNDGYVVTDGVQAEFNMDFLLNMLTAYFRYRFYGNRQIFMAYLLFRLCY